MAKKGSEKTPPTSAASKDKKKSKEKPQQDAIVEAPKPRSKKYQDPIKEEDRDPSQPRRGRAIGDNFGWTGKLPMTLLNELAQKQKWGRVEYITTQKLGQILCSVLMRWQNPKTKENISIKMVPEPHLVKEAENANEARHFGATFALHRINYAKNMKMVLPQMFGDYWTELEKERGAIAKADRERHDSVYNANPFTAFMDRREKREKIEKERLVRHQNEAKIRKPTISIASVSTSKNSKSNGSSAKSAIVKAKPLDVALEATPSFPRKAWDNAPFIDFPTEVRSSIEESVKKHISWGLEADHLTIAEAPDHPDYEKFMNILKSFHFRESHIKEAFERTSSFKDTLEWLLFHLPEDDLPPLFAKTDKDSGVSLTISKNVQQEYLIKRLSESGIDLDEIVTTLAHNDNDEIKTCVALTYTLAEIDMPDSALQQDPDSHELWVEELEGIKMLDSNNVKFIEGYAKDVATVDLNVPGVSANLFSLKLYRSGSYPHTIPGMHILVNDPAKKLAAYIKLSIIEGLLEYLVKGGYVGDCLIFSAVDWLEANISRIIENPGSLIRGIEHKAEVIHGTVSSRKAVKAKQKRSKQIVLLKEEIAALQAEYMKRLELPGLKKAVRNRQSLPAWKMKDALVSAINSNKVTLVTGETGSGKSTQIVQFILDDLCQNGDFTSKIMCTQPRRISTIGLAERISQERVDAMGKETGYIIRGENKTCRETRLTFVTTGVLLRMLQSFLTDRSGSSVFDNLSYIFVDEVHERSVDSDFLLMILKSVMAKFPKLRVILMSATINVDTFSSFFSARINHLHIEGRTFPIKDYFLDTILDDIDFTIKSKDGEYLKPKANSTFFKEGNLNYDMIAQLCNYVDLKLTREKNQGSILIFLPGVMEINQCIRKIEEKFNDKNRQCWCLPLHSALSSADQRRVFQVPKLGTRKIVVSTNVAETSITIPDCVVVIDGGRSKTMFYDHKLNATRLIENWCSKAEIGQRRGRSGRITDGNCYHLYSREVEEKMIPQPIPEIKRTRLENLYVVVKAMGINDVESFLSSGLDAPDLSSLRNSKKFLNDIGALESDRLTHLGRYLSLIPADLLSGKLLILGCIFGCVDMCLTLAALSTLPNPFLKGPDVRDKVKAVKEELSDGMGDYVALANAWEGYQNARRNGKNAKKFLTDHHLSYLTMDEIASTRSQYSTILKDIGFIPLDYKSHSSDKKHQYLNRNRLNKAVICAIITGAFYPQVARVQLPDVKYFKSIVGSVAIDPDAKKIKYWVRNPNYKFDPELEKSQDDTQPREYPASRTYVHPSSVAFGSDVSENNLNAELVKAATNEKGELDYEKARALMDLLPQVSKGGNMSTKALFVVFGLAHHTQKLYIIEITPTSTLATLLFGGEISYNLTNYIEKGRCSPGIVLDNWMPIRTWCKNGVLIKQLRKLLDGVIEDKLSKPYHGEAQDANTEVLTVIERILNL